MNNKQRWVLESIFENPIRGDVLWTDVESLLKALGSKISEGNGSRIRVVLNDIYAVFHRPHPRKEIDKGALKSMRRFLIEAGVN